MIIKEYSKQKLFLVGSILIIGLLLIVNRPDKSQINTSNQQNEQNIKPRQLTSFTIDPQYVDASEIIYPQQSKTYFIYSARQSHLGVDLSKDQALNGLPILYPHAKNINQMFKIKKLTEGKYKIYSFRQGNVLQAYMNNITDKQGLARFSPQSNMFNQIWEIIPAKYHSKTAFHIVSCFGRALIAQASIDRPLTPLILSLHDKRTYTMWIFKEVDKEMNFNNYDMEKQIQKLSNSYYHMQNISYSLFFDEWINFQYHKQLILHNQQGHVPYWLDSTIYMTQQKDLPLYKQPQNKSISFEQNNQYQCANSHIITYIWYGHKELPQNYKKTLQKCSSTTKLLKQQDFHKYMTKWNILMHEQANSNNQLKYIIDLKQFNIRQQLDLLKVLYLYFQAGIYSDFDTQINQQCWANIYTDQVLFTNFSDFKQNQVWIPQENFMMVRNKYNSQIRRMVQQEITKNHRWRECSNRQCLIINCQRHFKDQTYKKGYD